MKLATAMIGLAWLVLAQKPCMAGYSAYKTITCPLSAEETLKFDVPAKIGDLPAIDFDYPSKVVIFSFRDDNFLTVAVDAEDSSRVRLVISAQLNKAKGTYDGQMVTDLGGNQIQLDNGPVSCTAKR